MRTCTPDSNGVSPPMSIIGPALISRSASLPIASIKEVGGCTGNWDERMIDMKRMKNSCLRRAAATVGAKTVSLWNRRSGPGWIDMRDEKIALKVGIKIPKYDNSPNLLPAHHDQAVGAVGHPSPLRIV